MVENWRSCLDKGDIVEVIVMNLSKAFDTKNHDLLLAKLEGYGLSESALMLLFSYLSGRKQRVKVGAFRSNFLNILVGVPQGSILDPLLFTIFINDLFEFIDLDMCNFADDNSMYCSDKNIACVKRKLVEEMKVVTAWFQEIFSV